jgi:transporter family-2 protein
MQRTILSALAIALISGLAVGVQSTLNGVAGRLTGAVLTGLLVNATAGAASGLLLVAFYAREGPAALLAIEASTVGIILVAGLLGIGVISGIAFALPRIGVAAGLSAVIAGQMAVGVFVDTFGLGGGQPIPLNLARIGGLGLLALGTWLILPKG